MTPQSAKKQRRHWCLICFSTSKCLDKFRHLNNILSLLEDTQTRFVFVVRHESLTQTSLSPTPTNTLLVCRSSSLLVMVSRGRISPLDDPGAAAPGWTFGKRIWVVGMSCRIRRVIVCAIVPPNRPGCSGRFNPWAVVRKKSMLNSQNGPTTDIISLTLVLLKANLLSLVLKQYVDWGRISGHSCSSLAPSCELCGCMELLLCESADWAASVVMFLSAVGVLVALRCANRCLLLLLPVASGCFSCRWLSFVTSGHKKKKPLHPFHLSIIDSRHASPALSLGPVSFHYTERCRQQTQTKVWEQLTEDLFIYEGTFFS